ncbi:hypothetical protein ACGFW5_26615 [Streptomyces sp. NPDC048416]|uniref:hypothetical protein n=1 Tax=Streptomyces sp. NPDC048416 TaxID=3365546 RepID=UPI003716B5D0
MARNSIRIGGSASGPVVAGNDNRVEVRHSPPAPDTPTTPTPAAAAAAAVAEESGPTQTNTAKDHGTVYTVMNGELHVHHDEPGAPSTPPAP